MNYLGCIILKKLFRYLLNLITIHKRHYIILLVILSILNLSIGCDAYKIVTKDRVSHLRLKKFMKKGKYILVHEPDTSWCLTNPVIVEPYLMGEKSNLPEWVRDYTLPVNVKRIKINKKDSLEIKLLEQINVNTSVVLNTQIYVNNDSLNVILPIDSIQDFRYVKTQGYKIAFIVMGPICLIAVPLVVIGLTVSFI